MKFVPVLWACMFASAAHIQAQTTGITDYLGAYADGPGSYITVSLLRAGTRPMLLLSETRTEQLRVLFPRAGDQFTTGPALIAAEPIESELTFRRSAGRVVTLEMQRRGAASVSLYPRIAVRSLAVEFGNRNIQLRGSLLLPPVRHPGRRLPAIVMVHGSEESDRHSFGPLPITLAAHGYAVLTYDKRGTGESTGSWQEIGLEPLAEDVAAALQTLKLHSEIDTARIALIGTSEGAWVAALATRLYRNVRAMVAISGGAQTKREAYIHKQRKIAEEAGLAGAQLDSAIASARATMNEALARATQATSASGFDQRMAFDPTNDWSAFTGAFLYLGGEADVLEPAPASAAWFERLFRHSEHRDYTIKVLPKAHHSLITAVRGTPSEFNKMEGLRQLAPGYWDVLLRWLDARLLSR